MKYNQYLAVIVAGSLAACGGGSGSTTSADAPITTATLSSAIASSASTTVLQKTTVAQGMVTGFGSVIVNGVHYDVKNAAIDVDGDSRVESDLGVGQILRITGTVDADGTHGTATKVEGESQLRGAIESIDLSTGIIVAVGQSILLTPDTFYQDGVTADTLKAGDIIKVSAYTNADGVLVATRIEVKTGIAADITQIAGEIADLDTTAFTFTINGKTVDYSKAIVADDITLANGLLIRVRGNIVDDIFVASGTLQASPLNIKNCDHIDGVAGLDVGGLITDLVANTSFKLNDVTVLINSDTQYDGGTASDLADGLLVKIQGTLDTDKNLVASKIKIILKPQADDEGLVQNVDLTANTVTVNGVTFTVNPDTSFNDGGKDKIRLFSLKDIAVGNTVNVRGYKAPAKGNASSSSATSSDAAKQQKPNASSASSASSTGPDTIIATRIERHNAPATGAGNFKVEVHGLVESVTDSTIKIAGHSITVKDTTEIAGYDSVQAFLAAAVGLNIDVKGEVVDGVLVASSIVLATEGSNSDPRSSNSSRAYTSASAASLPSGDFPQPPTSSHSAASNPGSQPEFSSHSAVSFSSIPARSDSSRSAPENPSSQVPRSSSSASSQ